MAPLHRLCSLGVLFGVLLGVSGVAWSQEAASSPSSVAADADLWLRLLSSGGLPAVLGFLGYWLPRTVDSLIRGAAASVAAEFRDGITVRIAIPEEGVRLRLAPEDLAELARLVELRRSSSASSVEVA